MSENTLALEGKTVTLLPLIDAPDGKTWEAGWMVEKCRAHGIPINPNGSVTHGHLMIFRDAVWGQTMFWLP